MKTRSFLTQKYNYHSQIDSKLYRKLTSNLLSKSHFKPELNSHRSVTVKDIRNINNKPY